MKPTQNDENKAGKISVRVNQYLSFVVSANVVPNGAITLGACYLFVKDFLGLSEQKHNSGKGGSWLVELGGNQRGKFGNDFFKRERGRIQTMGTLWTNERSSFPL